MPKPKNKPGVGQAMSHPLWQDWGMVHINESGWLKVEGAELQMQRPGAERTLMTIRMKAEMDFEQKGTGTEAEKPLRCA